ncbi:ABC transporter substrate-binding protein [Propionibacteriaceae bacterium Y1685]
MINLDTAHTFSRRGLLGLSAAALGGVALSSCTGGSGSTGGNGGERPVLNVHASGSPSYQVNFNPLSTSVLPGAKGLVYEPLMAYTPMKPNEGQPWLAESMEFDEAGTTLTIKLREGVTWSDGTPFSAKDVAFTFNLYLEQPATNTSALPVKSASAEDDHTAVITFSKPVFAKEPQLGNLIMLPEHVFAEQDPMEFVNEKPIGTGPYVLKAFADQIYSFERNPQHWDADAIKINEIAYPASTTQTFTTHLTQGKLDWSGGFVANIDALFVKKDPEHHHYWYPGDGSVNLLLNQRKAPMNDLPFRKALSLAMDRQALSDTAMQGYTPPAHPTGLVLPAFESAMAPEYKDLAFERKVEEANSILDEAGYTRGADGVREKDGKKLAFDVVIPSGYTDWVAMLKLLQEQFAEIGVTFTPQAKAESAWADARRNGAYDITIASAAAGSAPYFLYRSYMSSEFKVADDEPASSNPGRWYDDETDKLFEAYESTQDEAEQAAAINGLQKIVVERLPLIPMLQSPNWFQYRTTNFVGWPTEEDPYALPAPYQFPDNLLLVKHLSYA